MQIKISSEDKMKRIIIICFFITLNVYAQSRTGIAFADLTKNDDWTMQQMPFMLGDISGVNFLDKNNGWAVGYNSDTDKYELLKTTDGGTDWTSSELDFIVSKISFLNTNIGFAAGGSGQLVYSA